MSATSSSAEPATAPGPAAPPAMPHPALFMLLISPFGFSSGFVIVTLAYQLTQRGVGAGVVADLIALSYLPQTWKFLWAPLVDTLSTRGRWYIAGAVGTGVLGCWWPGISADAATINYTLMGGLLLSGSFASTLLAMALENLMGVVVQPSARGRVAGWYQAGNLGGQGLGGGLALWLVQSLHWSVAASGGALCAVCIVCCGVLRWLPDPPREVAAHANVAVHAKSVGLDLWGLVRSRVGALAVLICFLPIGSGAASNLWAAVAGDWHASAQTVALVNGAISGVVSAAGCIVGGWLSDRIDRRSAYCLYGALQVAAALAMAACGRTETQFVAWTMAYAFITGLTYAGFTAVVLDAMGRTSGATKYNLLASLSNMPIAYMTLVDGHANDRWGATGMLVAEAVVASAGIALFLAVAGITRRRGAAQADALATV
jgi:MFS family permease